MFILHISYIKVNLLIIFDCSNIYGTPPLTGTGDSGSHGSSGPSHGQVRGGGDRKVGRRKPRGAACEARGGGGRARDGGGRARVWSSCRG